MSSQIIITLAHLLRQHSPSYDDEKDSLLDISASLAMQMPLLGEVHIVLTGSPRPTFAETNAWLLEHNSPPRKRSGTADSSKSELSDCCDLHDYMKESQGSTPNANMNDLCGSPTTTGLSVLSHYRQRKLREGDVGGGKTPKKGDAIASGAGPMVGHAIDNAIAQTKGVGLHSSRAKLLQGTIDRPLWDQRRWTDGECLFSDLVDRCGLESFANVPCRDGIADIADVAAGEVGKKLVQKTSNLSAHLITVPPQVLASSGPQIGMDDETVNEIARAVIRFLKRKSSPAVSMVYLVLPTTSSSSERDIVASQLTQAWLKLEQYNDMIGQPKLLAGAQIEFVDIPI